MTQVQSTQTTGQWRQMLKSLGDKLPKDLREIGYRQNPSWFNERIAELVKLDPNSLAAQQIEMILASGPFSGIEEHLNPFAMRRVTPTRSASDFVMHSVEQQLEALFGYVKTTFNVELDRGPALAIAKRLKLADYPKATGLGAFIRPTVFGELLHIENVWDNVGQLIELGVVPMLQSKRPFTFWPQGTMDSIHYELFAATRQEYIVLEAQQTGPFLVCPMHLGDEHAGRDVEDVRWEIEHAKDPASWASSAYDVGQVLFTNPHRLEKDGNLIIVCPADQYRFGASGPFDHALYFSVDDGKLYCSSRSVGDAYGRFGSAFGFVPAELGT